MDHDKSNRTSKSDVLRMLLPLLAIFAVGGLGIYLQHVNETKEADLNVFTRPFAPGCGEVELEPPGQLPFAGAFFSFTAATLLLLVTQVAVGIFAILLLAAMLQTRRAIVAGLLVAVAVASAGALLPDYGHAPTTMKLLTKLVARCTRVDDLLIVQERCGAFVATLLACSLGALLLRRKQSEPPTDAARLTRRFRALSAILYAGTILLVVSLFRLDALYEWIATTWTVDAKAVEALTSGLLRVWGAFYTTILAAVYIPAAVLLHEDARRAADRQALEEGPTRDEWMKQHGLNTGLMDVIPRILAILAPILLGELKHLTDLF